MSAFSGIISLFNTDQESYAPIIGPPTDENMVRLREAILTILYSISLGTDEGCPSGIILTDAAYKCSIETNVSFDPIIGASKLYNPSIKDNSTNGLRQKIER